MSNQRIAASSSTTPTSAQAQKGDSPAGDTCATGTGNVCVPPTQPEASATESTQPSAIKISKPAKAA